MKRREFIVGVSGAAIAEGAGTSSVDADALSREHFRDLVKRSFRFYDERSRLLDELHLVAVEDGTASTDVQQFDLIFEGVFGEEDLHEGTYVLQETRSRRSYAMRLQDRAAARSYRATFSLLEWASLRRGQTAQVGGPDVAVKLEDAALFLPDHRVFSPVEGLSGFVEELALADLAGVVVHGFDLERFQARAPGAKVF
jgi:hypothetical protein